MIDDARELALAKRALKTTPSNGKSLDPLNVGDDVQIQDQSGTRPNKWHNTGTISECLPNRQYHVIVDGSRRITLRNRRFLRKITPITPKTIDINDDYPICPPSIDIESVTRNPTNSVADIPEHFNNNTTDTPVPTQTEQWRSSRVRTKHTPFQAKLSGKSHVSP